MNNENQLTPDKIEKHPYRVIGTRPLKPEDLEKVTGRTLFAGDFSLPDMLYGAVLRSPHAHARIRSIDTRAAESMPGVTAVVTAADLPAAAYQLDEDNPGSYFQTCNVLARDKTLYYGHALAGVAATSLELADRALALIKVDYEILPPVMEVDYAMQPDAPILHDFLRTDELGVRGDRPTNVAVHARYERGDLEQGFAAADVIVERQFNSATVHQGYIEPQSTVVLFGQDGRLTVWSGTQGTFSVRSQMADILQIDASQIRVISMEVGGGFGGKHIAYLEPVAALLSKKSNHRPVKMVLTREEVLSATGPTAASSIRVKLGATRVGRICAASARLVYAAGAFPGAPVDAGMTVILGAYRIGNLLIDGYDVLVNRPKTEAYRAPGGSNAIFAGEVVVDELCEKLGIDRLEFRRLNGVKKGDRRADGMLHSRIGLQEALQAVGQHPHYTAPLPSARPGWRCGRGIACACWTNGEGSSSANASLSSDGKVSLVTGSVDLQGTRLTLSMQLAETLGIGLEEIHTSVGDTDQVGFTDGTWGSRTTFTTGWAVYELGNKIIGQLKDLAAKAWEVDPEQVIFSEGRFSINGQEYRFKQVAARVISPGSPIEVSASVSPRSSGWSFGAHIVDLEVDPVTGQVHLLRYTAIQDVGKAIHPGLVEGQMQGAVAQGIGWGMSEGYRYDEDGHLLSRGFQDYRIPTSLDVPPVEAVLVEVPNPSHPYGVRGVGEFSIVPPPAAIANAIFNAVGVRLYALPMTPERILEAIMTAEGNKPATA
jgi:xanthine dehydrogenase molybdenum-binding subunit